MKNILPLLICFGILFSCSEKEAPEVSQEKTDTITAIASEPSLGSEITCPKCQFKKKEMMPTDYCILKYTCTNCKAEIFPDDKDCCVFCTYGTHKCPSKQ
jgi:hypothetical protein